MKEQDPNFSDVIEKTNITSIDIDKALHTGDSFPTNKKRNKWIYAYNADMDANGKNNYGENLLKQIGFFKKAF